VASHPNAKFVKADPAQTQFRLGTSYEFFVGLDRFTISAHSPSLEDFAKTVDVFASTVVSELKIQSFTRIGIRPLFVKEYPDDHVASETLVKFNLIRTPTFPSFGITPTLIQPRYTLRVEDVEKGCLIQIYVNKRRLEAELPFAWEGNDMPVVEKTDLMIDIDYYTIAETSIGQLNAAEWVKQGIHVIRRDVDNLLEMNR
jgi:hypothetical protein